MATIGSTRAGHRSGPIVLGPAGTTSAGVFTQSRFAGPSVLLSRRYLNGANRATVVLSKNAMYARPAASDLLKAMLKLMEETEVTLYAQNDFRSQMKMMFEMRRGRERVRHARRAQPDLHARRGVQQIGRAHV